MARAARDQGNYRPLPQGRAPTPAERDAALAERDLKEHIDEDDLAEAGRTRCFCEECMDEETVRLGGA